MNRHRWSSQEIEPLRVAPCIEVFHGLAIDIPTALAMMKSWNRRDRAEQDGILPHLGEDLHTHYIAHDPGIEQGLGRVGRFGRNPTGKLFEHRTEVSLSPFGQRP